MWECDIPWPLNKTSVYSELASIQAIQYLHACIVTHPSPLRRSWLQVCWHIGDTQKNVFSTFLSSRNNFLDSNLVLCYAANYANQWVDVCHESCWQTCKAISLIMFKGLEVLWIGILSFCTLRMLSWCVSSCDPVVKWSIFWNVFLSGSFLLSAQDI